MVGDLGRCDARGSGLSRCLYPHHDQCKARGHTFTRGRCIHGQPGRADVTATQSTFAKNMTDYFVHPLALAESSRIGSNTRIWPFSHILPGAVIGGDCNICDHVFIENEVVIGDRVTIKCGVQVWDGVTIEDDVFIGPNVTFTNDAFPRSKRRPPTFAKTFIRRGASISANATILPGLVIGGNAMVGAGAVVTHDVPPNAVVVGNPARVTAYVDTANPSRHLVLRGADRGIQPLEVKKAQLISMPLVEDMRGSLTFGEYGGTLPFVPKRYFVVFDVPTKELRGEHAHITLHQFLVCLRGSCAVVVDDGRVRDEVVLDAPTVGLYVQPMVWTSLYKYTPDAVLLVLASDVYDAGDYLRNYEEFVTLAAARETP
jgi:UDP-2-acetamido-3-amino-2,3-dideoxy-glucuronate N-acetyltransferase